MGDRLEDKEKKNLAFAELANPEAIIEYLQSGDRRDNIGFLHHYTSVGVAMKIIRHRLWHLGKAQYMNDELEYDTGDASLWERLFFASFMGEDKESIAMWSMYGQPWEKGVKLSIPKKSLQKWMKDTQTVHEISLNDYLPTGRAETVEKSALRVSAVAYSNCQDLGDENEEILRWSTAVNKKMRINPANIGGLTGYVKNKAWAYEKEFRIMLAQDSCHGYQRAAIEVPDYVMDSMGITPGPLFEGDCRQILAEALPTGLQITDSLFKNKLNIRSICSKCEYKTGNQHV